MDLPALRASTNANDAAREFQSRVRGHWFHACIFEGDLEILDVAAEKPETGSRLQERAIGEDTNPGNAERTEISDWS
jgi:hypothetical protein